jgi:hypothetical protein
MRHLARKNRLVLGGRAGRNAAPDHRQAQRSPRPMSSTGSTRSPSSRSSAHPTSWKNFIASEIRNWAHVVKDAGITPE